MFVNENKQDFIAWAARNDFQHKYFIIHGENLFQRSDGLAFSVFDREFVMRDAAIKFKAHVKQSALEQFNIALID